MTAPTNPHVLPLHIAYAALSLDPGGLERLIVMLAAEERRRGSRTTILCLERPGGMAAAAREAGAEVVDLAKPPGLRLRLAPRLARILRELAPDVLHTHQLGALVHLGPAAWLARVPAVVHTEHGKHYGAGGRAALLARLATKFAGRVVAVSPDLAEDLRQQVRTPERKLSVVANGIDLAAFDAAPSRAAARLALGLPDGAAVIGSVGRIAEIKRYDRLLRAAAALRERLPNLRVVLAGDGPERPALERLAAELGLGGAALFLGHCERPQDVLPAYDAFALTSRSEGMPMSVLEAWASRVPVVCTRVGGVPALVADHVNGLLVPDDDPAALIDALARTLRQPERTAARVAAGRQAVEAGYSIAAAADRYRELYAAARRPGA